MSEGVSEVYRRHGEKVVHSENSMETHNDKIEDSAKSKSFVSEDNAIKSNVMKFDFLEEKLQEMRQSVVEDMNERLNSMMTEVVQQLQVSATTLNSYQKDANDNIKKKRNGKLMEKQFFPRNSYLTDLYEIKHIRTIYNIFFVGLIVLFLNTAVQEYIETGMTQVGIKTMRQGFGSITSFVQTWTLMLFSTFGIYLGFCIWAQQRTNFTPKSLSIKILDYGYLSAFLIYQLAFIVIPTKHIVEENMQPAKSLAIMMEQVRMLMKTYAFVRSTVPRVLAQKTKDEASYCPGFSKFLYFMFAPTLVYRDEYPRTKQIRWRFVLTNIAEIVLVMFYMSFIFERFIIPPFEKFGTRIFEPRTVILTIFSTILPGFFMFIFGFYCVLHSSQNCFAEMLRFADRLFYKDWWNCTSYDAYYRNWNIIVHDWLYTYIYKDLYEQLHSKLIATVTVFLVSAAFHEYILAFAFRFFYPVMMILFVGFGLPLVFISKKYVNNNIFLWLSLFGGNGILFTLYSMEFYARLHCPPYNHRFLDILLPRSWACHTATSNITSVLR